MRIIIKETGKEEELELLDAKNGCELLEEYAGNYDQIGRVDNPADRERSFLWDDEKDAYICDRENFNWWKSFADEMQDFEYKQYELSQKYGRDAVYDALGYSMDCDLEYQAANGLAALREAFPDDFDCE